MFVLYAQFASIIALHFFPSHNPTPGLLATFAVFALGFFARPIGGVLFGHYGDKRGRKKALGAAVLMMSLATLAIGLTPAYSTIGLAAPILLIIWRLFQGLSAASECSGFSAFVIDYAHQRNRTLFGSVNPIAVALGILGGASVGLLMADALSPAQEDHSGLRVPSIIAGPRGQ